MFKIRTAKVRVNMVSANRKSKFYSGFRAGLTVEV
jgi:hypothetical protein